MLKHWEADQGLGERVEIHFVVWCDIKKLDPPKGGAALRTLLQRRRQVPQEGIVLVGVDDLQRLEAGKEPLRQSPSQQTQWTAIGQPPVGGGRLMLSPAWV
jgi:hypothetical protein